MRVTFNGTLEFAIQANGTDGNPVWQMNWSTDTYETTTTAMVLIDALGLHDIPRVMNNIRDFTGPAVSAARIAGMKVLHTTSQPRPTSGNPTDVISPLLYSSGDHVFWSDQVNAVPDQAATVIVPWMQQNGIKDIVYAGYLANQCFLTRPAGLMNMQIFVNGLSPLPRFLVLRDCTVSVEEAGAVGFPGKETFMNLARIYPRTYTISNQNFLKALAGTEV